MQHRECDRFALLPYLSLLSPLLDQLNIPLLLLVLLYVVLDRLEQSVLEPRRALPTHRLVDLREIDVVASIVVGTVLDWRKRGGTLFSEFNPIVLQFEIMRPRTFA